ncbi:EcoAI/FtnUII family type I restriction enzme subunit R [Streptomyces sp. H39-S7]|uniref:EcoAI/FtnUII family type I restriction enzme subunit R n=1 Tax=Streptomyces sp. H39-S7 TaxID=3004357 RepID=UPI0022AF8F69|nr:DEAD/DEAH box helicase family protein [Streptomyces sp. H39-S7]MCZ4125401.1 DEAD/DEAH box helicase family protein [Streptomyces sp. H39-S7]
MPTSMGGRDEAATRADLIDPVLHLAGWEESQIKREFWIGDGQIVDTGGQSYRGSRLRADYVLEYEPGFPIAVVEAKPEDEPAETGVEQAKRYARGLALPVAYTTNGHVIREIDMTTGAEIEVGAYPSPQELWQRFIDAKGLDDDLAMEFRKTPFKQNLQNPNGTIKRPRYYQKAAVEEVLAAIARGDKRILLTLATGTGKTFVAYLIAGKLWDRSWPQGIDKPRVLYLADRNMLVDQPKDEYFIPGFGDDAVCKLGQGNAVMSRYFYFALYQSLDQTGDEDALFLQYPKDFFDLIIVDECHRGSSSEESRWREILEHFDSAVHLGMTATPVEDSERSTSGYFGSPVYTYSLGDGIRDGYLAPYRVNRILLNIDVHGWQPTPGQLDKYRNEIPDKIYGPSEFERLVVIFERTQEAARALTDYLQRTDPMAKTVVFCQDIEHAGRMRAAMANLNSDLAGPRNDYVFRVTTADGPPGMAELAIFRKTETRRPVVAITSKLLSTGVDMPTVRNIVFLRAVKSVPEFKQIIGRGTRLCEEEDKLVFTIIDFCDATKHFSRPDFDGLPLGRPVVTWTDTQGHLTGEEPDPNSPDPVQSEGNLEHPEPGAAESSAAGMGVDEYGVVRDPGLNARIRNSPNKYYVDGVEVFKFNESFYLLQAGTQELRLFEYRQLVGAQVRRMELTPTNLRAQWARSTTRRKLTEAFRNAGIDAAEVYKHTGHEDVDEIDLLLNLAYGTALVTRSERVQRVRAEHREFLAGFTVKAREILESLLDRYERDGITEVSAEALQTPEFKQMGSVTSLAGRFGGGTELHEAIDGLAARLYDLAL